MVNALHIAKIKLKCHTLKRYYNFGYITRLRNKNDINTKMGVHLENGEIYEKAKTILKQLQ